MSSHYEKFRSLHHQPELLLLGNAWNVSSAKVLEAAGIKAIGTSSSAIADTMGYEDGENIPFEELFQIISRIVKNVQVPVSADIETGYSSTLEGILAHIDQLISIGIAGINLEDSTASRDRQLVPATVFAEKIAAIRKYLAAGNKQLFINARTDAFLLKDPASLEESISRARLYEEAGADGLFVPFIEQEEDIRQIVAATKLPVNVMARPQLPSLDRLNAIGVKRVSMGGSLYWAQKKHLQSNLDSILTEKVFSALY
ncbi:MAG TPA: isocitrate lyase/phosphoenolpyruvate mutase family protein [Chitinophaga sp.]|uniref:isocitrate lyase/PEP mutase family protein n=1 Tax=Chitinophaga sp. TaxID=1869181 RepID=UPI002D04C4B8|nr:isocitrate lyase/phosphoenolpyruvate mutase family protein [Chitinophaga sp.]HVI45764.1 isocitrate lyase/phosphoenolpyruvate mutase family protein [Chitinophaga sp.]